jgi:protein-disulfide isomerase
MEDIQSGVDSGVNGTPTLFINEERLDWAAGSAH